MAFHPERQARIVIIGGGAIGCSLAYHLARAGETGVLLLEKAQITHGSTWHAAGLVGQLRGKRALTRLMQNSVAVFDRLEAETGMAIDWKKVGSLRLASSPERWSEIRRSMQLAKSFGFECHSLSAAEAQARFPHIDPAGVVGAAFIPSDGYVDPYALTQAYAHAARKLGATIEEGVTVTAIPVEGRRALGVETDRGSVGCEVLVNCAGLWARRVGEMAGVPLAAGVVEHQYFVTEKGLDLPAGLTTLRDPDNNFYLKPDVGGAFAIGGWEEGTRGCWQGRPPLDFARELFPANMDRLERFAVLAADRLPVLNEIGIRTIINGPIPVSADGEPIMGLAPELDNFYVACGFTAGIAASGGAGEAMANWIIEGDPGLDLWPFDVRRFGAPHAQGRYLEARAIEAYAAYYKIHWPGEESHAGRGLRRSPLHDALAARGAVFGARFGWERPNWFHLPGSVATETPSFEGKPGWFDAVAGEVRAIRTGVALIDQTSFSKFEIGGKGAEDALQRIAAGDLSGPPGRAVYTQLLQRAGRHRGGRDLPPHRAGPFPDGHRLGLRGARQWLGAPPPALRCCHRGRDQPLRGDQHLRAEGARGAGASLRRRPLERRLPLPRRPRDRHRAGPGAGGPDRLCGRARLGDLRAAGIRAARDGNPARGWGQARHRRCRLPRHRELPAGEGLSLLVVRHLARYQPHRGRARLRGGDGEGRLHRPRGIAAAQGDGAGAAAGQLRGRGLRALPRHRDGADRRQAGRLADQRGLRPPSRPDHRLRLPARRDEGAAGRDRGLRQGLSRDGRSALPLRPAHGKGEDMNESMNTARQVIAGLPILAATGATPERLGGLTNLVWRVGPYCLRIPGKGTEEYIDRANEAVAAREAAKAGVSPEVLHFDPKTGVMVTRFIERTVTMSPKLFASRKGAAARAGKAFRQLHDSGAMFPFRFELFAMIDDYLKILSTKDVELPPGYHDVVAEAEAVRAALAARPLPLAACHCDPLCENFLDTGETMWIVDWEYSGMNDPMWDLGDLSVEGGFDAALDEEILRAYFGGEPDPRDRGRMVIYKAMCDLLWTLWGLIQLANRNPADDFRAYADGRFARCKALMGTAEFGRHLAAVRG